MPDCFGKLASGRRRRGFTLIELLVVIAIMAILMALLLPAIQQAREAARRNQCTTQLSQMGIALQNYYDAYTMLPAGCVNSRGPIRNQPAGYHHSWIVALLPFLDQGPLWNAVSQSDGAYDPANRTAATTPIPLLMCPSETSARQSITQPMTGAFLSSYAGAHHPVESPIDSTNHGLFYVNSFLRYSEIPDGLADTIAIGEIRRDPIDLGWISGTRATLRNGGLPLNQTAVDRPYANDPETVVVEPSPADADIKESDRNRSYEMEPESTDEVDEEGLIIDIPAPPMASNPALQSGGFGSPHTGGANLLLADGRVRFVSASISQAVLESLLDRADGHLLESY